MLAWDIEVPVPLDFLLLYHKIILNDMQKSGQCSTLEIKKYMEEVQALVYDVVRLMLLFTEFLSLQPSSLAAIAYRTGIVFAKANFKRKSNQYFD